MAAVIEIDRASFRDPSGHVYHADGRIYRAVGAGAAPHLRTIIDRGLLDRWMDRGWVVGTREVPAPPHLDPLTDPELFDDALFHLEHDTIPFVSYPYEWPFHALKAAALLHLDLQIDALAHDIELSDASAYNVQFDGARPVFIDVLSFRHYDDGSYWQAQRQFCEQFLYPLLLRALTGVHANAWYRGSLEGISAVELNALLPLWRKCSWNVFTQVTLPARLAARSLAAGSAPVPPQRPLPKASYAGLLHQTRDWIATLTPRGDRGTLWSHYDRTHTYAAGEQARKRALVAEFVDRVRPRQLWDLGCNTGDYAALALDHGAGTVVGLEPDHGALERAFLRSQQEDLRFLPLLLDAANPSPDQGWAQAERRGLGTRGPADALLALAVIHHLAIGRNIPLDRALGWLVSLAPTGMIEFVQKSDPTVQRMLANRTDVFDGYDEHAFRDALGRHARISRADVISSAGRTLYTYERG